MSVPSLTMPPLADALLPKKVELVTVSMPPLRFAMPPPMLTALLPVKVLRVTVTVPPLFRIPPPYAGVRAAGLVDETIGDGEAAQGELSVLSHDEHLCPAVAAHGDPRALPDDGETRGVSDGRQQGDQRDGRLLAQVEADRVARRGAARSARANRLVAVGGPYCLPQGTGSGAPARATPVTPSSDRVARLRRGCAWRRRAGSWVLGPASSEATRGGISRGTSAFAASVRLWESGIWLWASGIG